ncbi:IclR family transcriptional regulator [Hydrogenophaga sp.]|jgi:IclR family acetate operon transcriptional repressor|uniref:IclR family transcriptional regulator n=1 Tax=Hydrogenophaga sp. TaxID=1904254 RepID=UPI003F71B6E0
MLVRTVTSALQIFEAFAEHRRPMNLSELSRLLDIPTSTCFGLMRTLEASGYLYEVGGRKMFYPTARWLLKSREIGTHDPVLGLVRPHLEKLRDSSGETVMLSKRLADSVVLLDVMESKQTIRYTAEVGQLKSLNLTSSGKALLSALSDEERDSSLLRLHGANGARLSVAQRTQLKDEIKKASVKGWYVGRAEISMDVMGVAVPVRLAGEVFALAVAGPLPRMDRSVSANAKQLLAAAKTLMKQL